MWILFVLFVVGVIVIDRWITMTPFASRLFRAVAVVLVVLFLLYLTGLWGRIMARV